MIKTSEHAKVAGFLGDAVSSFRNAVGPNFGRNVAQAGLTLASAAAIPAAAYAYEERNRARAQKDQTAQLVSSYKDMLEMHPALGQHRDSVRVQRMFNTLAKVNPTLASDPHAAGAYIRRAISDDELDTGAGTISLVDMASRFDASKARQDPSSMLRPWQRAEAIQSIGGGVAQGLRGGLESSQKMLDQFNQAHDPIAVKKRNLEEFELDERLDRAKNTLRQRMAQQKLFP